MHKIFVSRDNGNFYFSLEGIVLDKVTTDDYDKMLDLFNLPIKIGDEKIKYSEAFKKLQPDKYKIDYSCYKTDLIIELMNQYNSLTEGEFVFNGERFGIEYTSI